MRPTTDNRSGFTLVELMVAVALSAIILTVAVMAFTQGAGISAISHAKAEAMHNAQIGLDFLENDLEAAFVNPDGEFFIGDTFNDDGRIELLTLSGQAGIPACAHVWYYCQDRGEPGERLIRLSEPYAAGTLAFSPGDMLGEDAEKAYMVAYGVTKFAVRYYYGGTWFPAEGWTSTDEYGWDGIDDSGAGDDVQYRRCPEVIEITMWLVDSEGVLERDQNNPIKVRRLMTIPSSD